MKNNILFLVLVVLSLFTRFLPHPPNFTPILAIALFSGFFFQNKKQLILFPLLIVVGSDFILGISSVSGFLYISFLAVAILGFYTLKEKSMSFKSLSIQTLFSSMLFFVISNFGVWMTTAMYSKDLKGLWACYLAGVPFYRNTLMSTFIYSFVLFAVWKSISKWSVVASKAKAS